MRSLIRYCYFLSFCIVFASRISAQSIVINEVMYENNAFLFDKDGDSPDWIEIYNTGNKAVNLLDYKLTDDLSEDSYWTFPDYVLLPGDIVLVFASGKNLKETTELHTDFRLRLMEDPVFLLNPNNEVIDALEATCTPVNTSIGRYPDGTGEVKNMAPTPGVLNNKTTVLNFNYMRDTLTVNYNSGFYSKDIELKFSNQNPQNIIVYTLNGDIPEADDAQYSGSLILRDISGDKNRFTKIEENVYVPGNNIYKGNIVRAVVYSAGCPASNVITNTYFINSENKKNYPVTVVSLITEKDNLFDKETGIYRKGDNDNYNQRGKKWERPAHIEMFDTCGNQFLDQDAGIRLNGSGSRASNQKSFRLYAREEYGKGAFQHPFFKQKPELDNFKTLILRSCIDWEETLIKDELAHTLVKDMDVNNMAHQTSVLFINGEYWGIYSLRERQDEYYIQNKYKLNTNNLDIIGCTVLDQFVEQGSMNRYNEFVDVLESMDAESPDYFNNVSEYIDIDELIDYFIAEMYLANTDFPQNNVKLWNAGGEGGKWHYFFFDFDGSMIRANYDLLSELNSDIEKYQRHPDWSTLVLRNLLHNEQFRNTFMQRFYLHLSTTFETGRVLHLIDEFEQRYEPLVAEQIYRWNSPTDIMTWKRDVNSLRSFVVQRTPEIVKQLDNNFPNPFCVYPNPSDGTFNIDFAIENSETRIKLYDVNGRFITSCIKPAIQQNMYVSEQLSPGLYVLEISLNGFRFTSKLIITP